MVPVPVRGGHQISTGRSCQAAVSVNMALLLTTSTWPNIWTRPLSPLSSWPPERPKSRVSDDTGVARHAARSVFEPEFARCGNARIQCSPATNREEYCSGNVLPDRVRGIAQARADHHLIRASPGLENAEMVASWPSTPGIRGGPITGQSLPRTGCPQNSGVRASGGPVGRSEN